MTVEKNHSTKKKPTHPRNSFFVTGAEGVVQGAAVEEVAVEEVAVLVTLALLSTKHPNSK